MGAVGKSGPVVVTGAAGFLGRHIVEAARAEGLQVLAVVRRNGLPAWRDDPAISVLAVDLADAPAAGKLAPYLAGVRAIIHAAGPMTSDVKRLARDGVGATVNLLTALESVKPRPPVVLVSSLAVYDVRKLPQYVVLTEETPVLPAEPHAYGQTKLMQESLLIAAAGRLNMPLVVLRPGILFGAGHLRNGHLGVPFGMGLIRIGAGGFLPLCYVKNCAQAVVMAALKWKPGSQVAIESMNLVDCDLPTRKQYVRAIAKAGWPRLVLPLPWAVWRLLASCLAVFPGLRSRLPGILQPQAMRFRLMPMRYSNERAQACLGWVPRFGFDQAMADCLDTGKGAGR